MHSVQIVVFAVMIKTVSTNQHGGMTKLKRMKNVRHHLHAALLRYNWELRPAVRARVAQLV